jgi:hypothetical protein
MWRFLYEARRSDAFQFDDPDRKVGREEGENNPRPPPPH